MNAIRPAALALLLLAASGCDEKDCLSEKLTMSIGRDDTIELTSHVEISVVAQEKEHARLGDRAARLRDELAREGDAWSRRFALLTADEESVTVRKSKGVLVSVQRSAKVARGDIPRFFGDTALSFYFMEGDDWTELVISAGESRRASSRDRERVARALDRFAVAYAAYAAASDDFFHYLDENPGRVDVIVAKLKEETPDTPATTESEDELVKRWTDAIGAFGAFEVVDEGEEISLDAAARLVYDPFPAELTLTVPGPIVEAEGFERSDATTARLRRSGLTDVVRSLRDRWVTPDILTLASTPGASDADAMKILEQVASGPRKSSRPSPADIRAAVEQQFRPRATYRVRWQNPVTEERAKAR